MSYHDYILVRAFVVEAFLKQDLVNKASISVFDTMLHWFTISLIIL